MTRLEHLALAGLLVLFAIPAFGQDATALPETNFYEITVAGMPGRMVLRLFNETPLHRDNFKRLVAEHYFDGTTFHRIIAGFMIQGGDPLSRDEDPTNDGNGGPEYTIPAEFLPYLFHKRGALAAAREGDDVNPERRSSGSQFYIVHGRKFDEATLEQVQNRVRQMSGKPDFKFSPRARKAYMEEGGAPHLDQSYTIFGELVEGFDLLDRIATVPTARSTGRQDTPPETIDRPFTNLPMTVRPLENYQVPRPSAH